MKQKIQRIAWILLYVYHIIITIEFITNKNGSTLFPTSSLIPRLYVFYDFLLESLGEKGRLLQSVLLIDVITGGVLVLLLIPVLFVGTSRPDPVFVKKLLCVDLVLIILWCLADILGCIFSLPSAYRPLLSGIVDCFVIALSVWSLLTTRKQITSQSVDRMQQCDNGDGSPCHKS